MLEFNGKQYAEDSKEFQAINAHGFYRVNRGRGRVSVSFLTPDREPIALISPDGAVVTAYKTPSGVYYLFGCTKQTEAFLGIEGMRYSVVSTMAYDVVRALAQSGAQV